MEKKYQGVVVPMVTPVTEKGDIDTDAVGKIMEQFAQNDISPLVLGTTGESSSFSEKESLKLLSAALDAKGSEQMVYAGLVSNNVEEQVQRGKTYLDKGADVVVATLPSYYILTEGQMKGHFEYLANSLQGPLMIYNIKATTQMSIPLYIIAELSEHPHIWGLKDSERDEQRLAASIAQYKDRPDFSFFCGWGAQSFNSLKMGADGIVPSTGNIVPEMYKVLYEAVKKGDEETAWRYQDLTDQVAKIYQGGKTLGESLAALKLMMKDKGWCQEFMKAPLSTLPQQDAEEVMHHWKSFYIAD